MDPPEAIPPSDVELDRQVGLTLRWPDGALAHLDLVTLRVMCPCAECRGLREQDRVVWPKPSSPQPLEALGAELVGAWGLSITWNDGHSTGIYPWNLLRDWGGA